MKFFIIVVVGKEYLRGVEEMKQHEQNMWHEKLKQKYIKQNQDHSSACLVFLDYPCVNKAIRLASSTLTLAL